MKSLFRILACLLFSCVFINNAHAEEKVSREQVDTLVARVLRTTLIQPEIQFIIYDNKYERDKLICEYLSFKSLSDATYDQMKDRPAAELKNTIHFAGTYVFFRLMSDEFWKTFRKYVDKAEKDKKFDYAIRDSQFSRLSESVDEDFPELMKMALRQSVIPVYHTGIYVPKVLTIAQDKLPILLVKTLMEYFSYEEFVDSHAECLCVMEKLSSEYLKHWDVLVGKVYNSKMKDSVVKNSSELNRLAEYMKLSRTPMYISNGLHRPTEEIKLKAGQYKGETYDGMPDGEGTLIDKKGVKYVGAFKNGLRHGRIFVYSPEKEKVVQFWYNGKLQKDIPVSLREDGTAPEAVKINGQRFGYGCYYNNVSKSTYVGFFVDGDHSGPGKIVTPKYTLEGVFNGDRVYNCVVEWNNTNYKSDKFAGTQNGILRKGVRCQVRTDGTQRMWKGEFVDGKLDGKMAYCSISEKDTTRYEGLYAYSSMYGQGEISRNVVHKDGMRESFRYTGNIIKSRAYGEGAYELVMSDFPDNKFNINRFGVKLRGQYTEGKDTVIVKAEGTFYDNDLVEGKVYVSNGNFMMGRFADGVLVEGRMIKKYSDGSSYDGECREGKYNGYGKIVYPDGTSYEGMFEDGSPVGMERNYMAYSELVNVGKHTRTFVFDNLANKKGVASLVTAAGVKVMVREMASVEVTCYGKFKDDIMTAGKVTVSDGTWLEGFFEDGVLIQGRGKTVDKYGTVYTGEIKNGFPHGKGECQYKDGTVFKGNFVYGNRMDGTHYTSEGEVIKVYQ